MTKTATINMRIEPTVKAQAEDVFSSFGISITDAINIFLHASIMEGGFPFQPKQPRYSKETLLAIQEARAIMDGKMEAKRYPSLSALLKDVEDNDA
ncbi:MAG: type II toxin-antitoxin system RelB/DinJ family antitoxin [Selenomonas sp.]